MPDQLDTAAVEAMKRMPQETRTFGNEITVDRLTFEYEGARVITEAYRPCLTAARQALAEQITQQTEMYGLLNIRLTRERAVREKLVEDIKQCRKQFIHLKDGWSLMCPPKWIVERLEAALTKAEKLEDAE